MNKNVSLPQITPLQFLVLALLVKSGELAGRTLRDLLAEHGVRSSGPQFYQMMGRLEDAKNVEGWYSPKEIENQVVNERRYRVTAQGRDAWRNACDFYSSHGAAAGRVANKPNRQVSVRGGKPRSKKTKAGIA